MRVLFDVDGVLADFTLGFTTLAQELGLVDQPWGQSKQVEWKLPFRVNPVWELVDNRMNWWMTLEPLVSFDEISLINMAIYQHDVYFITNRQDPRRGLGVEAQTMGWLDSIGIDVAGAEVYRTDNKAAMAHELGLDLGIDDRLENLVELAELPEFTPVAMTWPYNIAYEGPRVSSVKEFCEAYL